MMKGILFTVLLAFTGTAVATDLSSVGTTGKEAIASYSYARDYTAPGSLAQHQAMVGVQLNKGNLGSVALEVGDTQYVAGSRVNYPTFAVTYANGLEVGPTNVVGSLGYAAQTSNTWIGGNNSSNPVHTVTGTVEVNAPVTEKIRGFVDYSHSYSRFGNANQHDDAAAIGAYVIFSQNFTGKVGYTHAWAAGQKFNGVMVSAGFHF